MNTLNVALVYDALKPVTAGDDLVQFQDAAPTISGETMDNQLIEIRFEIRVWHEQGTDTLQVRKEDSHLFLRYLETMGISAEHHSVVGNPKDQFVFESDERADYIYKVWGD